jgi:CHAT domain
MRVSLSKDPSSKPSETLVQVEVSEMDELPTYSHSFKYKVPSGTDKKGKAFGEIIIYTDKTATSGDTNGDSYFFDLEECHNKDCNNDKCPKPNRLLVADVFHTMPKGNALQEFGAALFKALFSGYVGQLLKKIKPTHPNGGIYLQLNDNEDLDAIPWEYANDRTTLLVHQRIFSRVHNRPQDPLSKLPLRILAVVPDPVIPSNEPGAADLADLHLSEQFRSFMNGFTKNKKAVKLERVFPPTVHQMDVQLMEKCETATILHFMGHCGQRKADGPRALIFEHNDNGKQEYIDASRLVSTSNLRLAFLSACDSRDIARVLVERGVPHTIGSSCSIPNDLAREFEFEFYKFLTGGSTVEKAMWQARASLQNPDDICRHDYFAGSMILYSSRFGEGDSMFKCEEGNPEIELHEPPHNLTELAIVSGFSGCKKELSKLYIDLKRMVDRGSGLPHIYTIKGVGGPEFVVEAMRRMAHLFPGGIFAWAFDKEITSAKNYFRRLGKVMFSEGVWTQLMEKNDSDIQELGSVILKEFQTHATCLLILDRADILDLGRRERNKHAETLGSWLEKVTMVRDTVKIILISKEQLNWLKGGLIDLNKASDLNIIKGELNISTINMKEGVHAYFGKYFIIFHHQIYISI